MDLEQQLSAALAPCKPAPELRAAVMARLSSPAQSARGAPRKPSRAILFGTIVVVAVAAAMLVMRITGAPAPEARTAVLVPEPAPAPEQAAAPVSESVAAIPAASQAPAATQPVAETPEKAAVAKEPAVEVTPFTVRMKPLQNKATDAPSRAAIDSFYASVVSGLLGVSGLTLIDENSPGTVPDAPADCEISISGEGPMPGNKFNAIVGIKAMSDFAKGAAKICSDAIPAVYTSGDIAPACAGAVPAGFDAVDPSACTDPVSSAAGLLTLLRKMAFPYDPARTLRLQARLQDSRLDPQLRLRALQGISPSLGGTPMLGATNRLLHDPAVVKGAIQLVATATDPAIRAQVWREMRTSRNLDLVNPLIASLREDPDGEVRLAAVMTLTADYGDDPRARTALQAVMREDSRPDVRAFAQRAIMGDEAWKNYIVSSLQDRSRPETERVAALLQQSKEAVADQRKEDELKQMFHDEGAVKALAEVLPKAFTSGLNDVVNMTMLLSRLGLSDDPAIIGQSAITDMLLDDLARNALAPGRQVTVGELIRRRDVPKVRTALEKIAASDPDLRLRQRAAAGLKSPP